MTDPLPRSPDPGRRPDDLAEIRARKARYANLKSREGQALQYRVVDGIRALGWRAIAARPVRQSGGRWGLGLYGDVAGFPDILAVKDRLVLAELKLAEHTELSQEQEAWHAALRAAGVDVQVWRGSRLDRLIEELR